MTQPAKDLTSARLSTVPPQSEDPMEILAWAVDCYGPGITLATALGPQSLVMIDMLSRLGRRVQVVLLDTGVLFAETHALKARVERRYGIKIRTVTPELSVEDQGHLYGDKLWASNPDLCCRLRKVEPLRRALHGMGAWITGVRRDQSPHRAGTQAVEWDESHGLVKVNPLVAWTREQIFEYLAEHGLPYNELLDQGYSSLGCQPCTSRVDDPSDERAGRWAGTGKTECGIHGSSPGAAVPVARLTRRQR